MSWSGAPESSSAKRVVLPKAMGNNSNDIGAWWSGITSLTKEDAFSMHPSRVGHCRQ